MSAALPPRTALVTGSSGFIGFHLCRRLLDEGWRVVGLDNLSDYYDVSLKERRQAMLCQHAGFSVVNDSVETPGLMLRLFDEHRPDVVVHLAAQAGVRYSIENPRSYLESNIVGTFEILEAARAFPPAHMLLASTSSAYGANTEMPYREVMKADHQMSFYAATKKATEAMAHSYAHLFGLPVTMFRFFTVYGPWGRPDMALFKFTKAILEGQPIDVYNFGDMLRDFTYIDDIAEAVVRLSDVIPQPNPAWTVETGTPADSSAPYRVYNIGNSQPVKLTTFIGELETALGVKAQMNLLPLQPGDVLETSADTSALEATIGFKPSTELAHGLARFVAWYRDFYAQPA